MPYELHVGFELFYKSGLPKISKTRQTFDILTTNVLLIAVRESIYFKP